MEVSLNYCSQNGGNVYRAPYYNRNPNIGYGTAKVCKIMAFMAGIRGLGLLSYILLGFRYMVQSMVSLVVTSLVVSLYGYFWTLWAHAKHPANPALPKSLPCDVYTKGGFVPGRSKNS